VPKVRRSVGCRRLGALPIHRLSRTAGDDGLLAVAELDSVDYFEISAGARRFAATQ
jgi:hypothetical protein